MLDVIRNFDDVKLRNNKPYKILIITDNSRSKIPEYDPSLFV